MKNIFIYVLIRSWNAYKYFDRCIDSVLSQNYNNYKILFVDDNSGYSIKKRSYIKNKLRGHFVKFNKKRLYSLRNAYKLLKNLPDVENTVVFNLDGDDWLLDSKALEVVAKTYNENKNCFLTYGECLLWDGNKLSDRGSRSLLPYANYNYSKQIIKRKLYREEPFYPLHPRTWKLSLFKKIHKKDFLDPNGKWLRFAEDQAIFYPMLEMINGKYIVIKEPLYVHNFAHKHSDLESNLLGLVKDELIIRRKPKYEALF